jgi:hypothetical protein
MTKSEAKHDSAALAEILRRRLAPQIATGAVTEKRMFGGMCFLLRGNMLCVAGKKGFMFRVGIERQAEAARLPGAAPVFMQKRFMPGFYRADPAKTGAKQIAIWLSLSHAYVGALPAKTVTEKRGTPTLRPSKKGPGPR